MLKEFKKFISRGNVLDLAVGVIIGGAFSSIVTSLVNNIFTPIIGLILGFKLGIVTLVLSTFLALPYAVASVKVMKSHEFPYGPFLAGALFIVFFHMNKFNLLLNFLFKF